MTSIPHHIIDLNIRVRDLKRLLKKIKPVKINNYALYSFRDGDRVFNVIAIGEPVVKYKHRVRRDILSGLTYRIREASILHGNYELIKVYWDKSYYRIELRYTPLSIKILVDA